jgi:hypothetical protein
LGIYKGDEVMKKIGIGIELFFAIMFGGLAIHFMSEANYLISVLQGTLCILKCLKIGKCLEEYNGTR